MIFKVRASGAGKIMTDPRTKTELLSETCKEYVRRQWIADKYNREEDVTSLAIQKGLANEETGITQLSLYLNEMLDKNIRRFENDFLTGTPDIICDDVVYDIKCSYSIWTYAKADLSKDYLWQLLAYMELTGLRKANLVYVLTDTPKSIIQAEVKSICWRLQDDSSAKEIEAELTKQMTYSDIPSSDRIKVIPVEFDVDKIKSLYERVELCRSYYAGLSLTPTKQLTEV